jgi:hypothetical protein
MIILLLLVIMAEMKPAYMPTHKSAPPVKDIITCTLSVPSDAPASAASLPGRLRRSVRVSSLVAYETLSPKSPPRYLSKRPKPIDAWTDHHLDRYFNNWGPHEYFLYAMKLWRERIYNTYNDIHLELEDLYG